MQKFTLVLILSLFLIFSIQAAEDWEKDLSKVKFPISSNFINEPVQDLIKNAGVLKHPGENTFDMLWSSDSLRDDCSGIWATDASNDLDGDGFAEIIVSDEDGYTYLFENTGDNTFEYRWGAADNILTEQFYTPITVSDLDGDGLPEIVTGFYNSGNVYFYEWDGVVGSDNYTLVHSMNFTQGAVRWFAVDDLDSDANQEIVIVANDTCYVYEADASFVMNQEAKMWGINSYSIMSALTGDLNNNGVKEVIFAHYNNSSIYIWENTAEDTYANVLPGTVEFQLDPAEDGVAFQMVLTDFDSDGFPELYAATGSDKLLVFEMQSSTWDTAATNMMRGLLYDNGNDLNGIASGDGDEDGNPDLYFVSNDDHTYDWEYMGGDLFDPASYTAYDLGIFRVANAEEIIYGPDLDGDGEKDLIVGHEGTSATIPFIYFIEHYDMPVTVHFRANTAGVPDTLGITSTVQIRGSAAPLQWDGTSTVFLNNEGSSDQWGSSDYWYGSAQFPVGDTIYYKFYTNANDTVYGGAPWEHQGWEGDLAGGDRVLDLAGFAGTDTVLDVQFVNGYFSGAPADSAPYTTNDSTFVVYFRVNVQGFKLQGFDAAQHKLGIRGSNTDDWGQTGELGWGTTYLLTPENNHANGGSQQYDGDNFYSGAVHFPMQYIDDGVQWKFVVHYLNSPLDDDWGNLFWDPGLQENVQFTHTNIEDTTLYWRWYDTFTPAGGVFGDTVEITFQADMSTAIANNGFTPGDTALAISGWNLTGGDVYRSNNLVKQGFTNIYAATDTVATNLGEDYQYNYYVIKDGIEYREIFYDFTDPSGGSSAEKRKVNITSSPLTVLDDSDDPISIRRKPNFRNLSHPAQDVDVYYTCDLRPAYYQVLQGDTLKAIQGGAIFNVTDPDSVYPWGVRINGPATYPTTGGWQSWGIVLRDDTTRMMYDDGTHGDEVAGDTIFTADAFTYYADPDSACRIGQEFKFGVAGGDNEGGYGNNHIENIDDSNPTSYVRSQFGSIDPVFYWAWDFGNQTPNSIGDENLELPKKFALYQNYPNPFNPTTNFKFDLPNQTDVKLVIYNVLGQQVVTLIDDNLKAGDYAKTWNGLDQHGSRVATGVYFYKLVTNEHTAVKKLIMVK